MFPSPFPFTLYSVTAGSTPPSPTEDYCYGGDWVQGKIGNYGMVFDGTDEYVTTPSVSDIEFGNDSTFTVAFWVKSAQDSFQGFIGKRVFNLANYGWVIGRDIAGIFGNNNKFFASVSNGTGTYGLIVSDAAIDDQWHHVAFTRDGATPGNTILYIDGVAQADTTMASTSAGTSAEKSQLVDGGQPLYVGRYWHTTQSPGYNLNGTIDDIGIWDVVLPASTIQSLYNSGTGRRVDAVVPPSASGDYVDGILGNYALSFDSSDSPANYIDINNYSDIHTSPSGSISMWIKPNVTHPSFPTLVAAGDNAVSNTFFEYYIDTPSGKVNLVVRNAGTNHTRILNDTAITQGEWNHVVLTSDGTTGKIYLNGVDDTIPRPGFSNNGGYFSDLTGLDNLTLGIMEYNGGTLFAPFSGSMDEVAFYNVELDSGAVSALYNNGTGSIATNVSSSNLLLYYNFEGGPGTSALVDRSGNNHTGSLTNMDAGSITALKMYYDFEIGESNPVSGNFPTSTTVYDIVTSSYYGGTPHTGTMTNMAVADFGSWEQGRIGKYSLKFVYNTSADGGGTSLNSTYVDIGGTATDFARTDTYSISGWLKPNYDGSEADRCDVFANNVGGQFPQGWYVLAFQKKVYFFFGTSGAAYIIRQTNSAVLDTTEWVHFTITYDGSSSNSGIKIYINGSEAASTGGSSGTFNGTVNYSSARLRIGGMANGYSAFHRFPGNMDELAVWDVELDSGAAAALYNGALANSVSSSNLVAYYDMETDGPGNLTLKDLSTNAISGSMINMSSGTCGEG